MLCTVAMSVIPDVEGLAPVERPNSHMISVMDGN